jgi:dUTP pyrophosphatase
MSGFANIHVYDNLSTIIDTLKNNYDKFMILKIFVDDDTNNNELLKKYIEAATAHNVKIQNNPKSIDAGFDLYAPSNDDIITFPFLSVTKVDFKIKCSAAMYTETKVFNTGYYMYPRSSISKTSLRLANSTGIIDAGYRGNLIAMLDSDEAYTGKKFDRYIQICAPSLVPIIVEIVDSLKDLGEETDRGAGGFGSTGR